MVIVLTLIHVIVCLFLVIVVLLQSGKAADLAGAFGGAGSQAVFGPRGSATVLSKATTIAAALFMFTSLSLSILATRNGGAMPGFLNKVAKPASTSAPAGAPAPVTPIPAGQTVPITATPEVNGQKGAPQTMQVPVVPAEGQQKTAPATR